MESKKLEVGDIIYETNRFHGLQQYRVERVTASQAIYRNGLDRCKRELSIIGGDAGNWATRKIGDAYQSVYLANEALDARYLIHQKRVKVVTAIEQLSKINTAKLSVQQLDVIIEKLHEALEVQQSVATDAT